jgi:cytochrome P450
LKPSGGPRLCIGWRYGMLFMKACLVNFLRNYEATTSLKFEELEYEVTLTMKIVQRCMISVKKRIK